MAVHTLLQPRDRAALLERAARLNRDASPRWGRMDAPQMLRHCAEALRMSLGEIHPRPLGSDARALERDGAAVWVVGPDDDG